MPQGPQACAIGYLAPRSPSRAARLERHLQEWAAGAGMPLRHIFRDDAGDRPLLERPGFLEALVKLRQVGAAALVTPSPAELGPGVLPAVLADVLLLRLGARLVLLSGGVPRGARRVSVKADQLWAGLQRLLSLERQIPIQAGLAERGAAGRRRSRHLPYGYRLADDGVSLLGEPNEAELLRAVRRHHLEGLSYREIAERLAAEGHRPRAATTWHRQTVASLVRRASAEPGDPEEG